MSRCMVKTWCGLPNEHVGNCYPGTLEDLVAATIRRDLNKRLDRFEIRTKDLEADLCAHSIATRKADDDLAARIERLESAHRATVPVDAMRRLIEFAFLYHHGVPRDRDRFTALVDLVLTWEPAIGNFWFDMDSGRFRWQDGKVDDHKRTKGDLEWVRGVE